MGLFKPTWQHKDVVKRLGAVYALTDDAIREKIALTDSEQQVREAAILGMNDKEILKRFVLSSPNEPIQFFALERLEQLNVSKDYFREIALNHANDNVRIGVLKRFDSENMFELLDEIKRKYQKESSYLYAESFVNKAFESICGRFAPDEELEKWARISVQAAVDEKNRRALNTKNI